MKKLNIICTIMAIVAVIACAVYVYYEYANKDTTSPSLIADGNIRCNTDASQQELLAGLTASDDKDGDLTDKIMVSSISLNDDSSDEKTFDISYIVFDSSNNSAMVSRKLIYTDYHSPHFAISGELRFDSISTVDLYSMITAEDCIDGDISGQITIEMDEDYLNAISYGTYSCTVSVTNSLGDTAELPLSFTIYDAASEKEQARPDIALKEYLVYLELGEEFDPESELDYVTIEKVNYQLVDSVELDKITIEKTDYGYKDSNSNHFARMDDVEIDSSVDTDTPGVYEVTYSMKNPVDGTMGKSVLTVVVE